MTLKIYQLKVISIKKVLTPDVQIHQYNTGRSNQPRVLDSHRKEWVCLSWYSSLVHDKS